MSKDASSTYSTVQTVYAACGCSPLGKMSQQSQPYASNGAVVYAVYTYDGVGRTMRMAAADGSATSYLYQGNMVTVTDPPGNACFESDEALQKLLQHDTTEK